MPKAVSFARLLSILSLVTLVGACCTAQPTAAPEVVTPEPKPEPKPKPEPVDGDVVPSIDPGPSEALRALETECSTRPEKVCCQAETPVCEACREAGEREFARWNTVCAPMPDLDCGAPAPLQPCCRALLPKCTNCVDRQRRVAAAWQAKCKP